MINTMTKRITQKTGVCTSSPTNPMRKSNTKNHRQPSKQFIISFLQFVSETIQRSFENVCGFGDGLFTEFGTNCVKNFVKKSIHKISSRCVAIYLNSRVSCVGIIATSPRVSDFATGDELNFPILVANSE
jgi:hypothetical protein